MRVDIVYVLILAVLSPVLALPYVLVNGTPVARDASRVLMARNKPSHSPSPSPRPHLAGFVREPRVPVFKPRAQEQEIVLSPGEASAHLCPESMTVCPITSTAPSTLSGWIQEGYECVDAQEDLTSCGGCSTLDQKYDCTAIEGARTVSCIVGTCRVNSCKLGYALGADGSSCLRTA